MARFIYKSVVESLMIAFIVIVIHVFGDGTFDQVASGVKEDDVACLLYTSGSTALPKGVPLLHQGLIDNMWEIGERQHLIPADRLWLAVSLFWSLASVNALFALLTHRATVVLQHHFY